jgi:hypothetical protein
MSPHRAPRTRIVVISQPSAGDGEGFVPSARARIVREIRRRLPGGFRPAEPPPGPPELARAPAPEQVQPGGIRAGWARVVSTVRSVTDRFLRWVGLR